MRLRAPQLILIALVACFALVGAGRAAEPSARNAAPTSANAARANAGSAGSSPSRSAPLDQRVQEIKREVMGLNRDLQLLEEELLYPASSQVAVFVSLDVGKAFTLDSVQIKLDDKVVANYLYTPHELAALQRGGVQRVFMGNLAGGEHELVATFNGVTPNERNYQRAAKVKFDKGAQAKFIQLRIEDAAAKLQPEMAVKVWQ